MKNIFDSILVKTPKRNVFDLSHEVKLTANMGELVPFYLQEVVPGDTFICNSEMLLRVTPMITPVMHRVDVYSHFFYVPNRIIWKDWEKFITGDEDITVPVLRINDTTKEHFYKNGLSDYLGIPPTDSGMTVEGNFDINALPFFAYRKIYEDYYRDQNLQPALDFETLVDAIIANPADMLIQPFFTDLQIRAWEKDYFTSALPWAQKGDEVMVPMGGTAPIIWNEDDSNPLFQRQRADDGTYADPGIQTPSLVWNKTAINVGKLWDSEANAPTNIDLNDTHVADLTQATGISVNDLRRYQRIQMWMERQARAGSRYIETLLAHFGVMSDDARLQRPEYLGGGKNPVVISEVLSTVGAAGAPQGTMTGHAVSVGKSNEFKSYHKEHGYIIGIMSVMPRTNYSQGINKMFLKSDKFDFYWPEFAQLGEQEVEVKELYCDYEDTSRPTLPFGYQSRYAEYKYQTGRIAGEMRNSPFDGWHFSRIFEEEPALNSEFISCVPSERPFPVKDGSHKLIVQIFNYVKAIRPIPYFNTPQL